MINEIAWRRRDDSLAEFRSVTFSEVIKRTCDESEKSMFIPSARGAVS